jgi:hypothetical protein
VTQRIVVKTHVPAHHAVRDPELGADHDGHPFCRCGLPIKPGDPRHTLPADGGDGMRRAAHDVDEG